MTHWLSNMDPRDASASKNINQWLTHWLSNMDPRDASASKKTIAQGTPQKFDHGWSLHVFVKKSCWLKLLPLLLKCWHYQFCNVWFTHCRFGLESKLWTSVDSISLTNVNSVLTAWVRCVFGNFSNFPVLLQMTFSFECRVPRQINA